MTRGLSKEVLIYLFCTKRNQTKILVGIKRFSDTNIDHTGQNEVLPNKTRTALHHIKQHKNQVEEYAATQHRQTNFAFFESY
jgi:hypothetical protein